MTNRITARGQTETAEAVLRRDFKLAAGVINDACFLGSGFEQTIGITGELGHKAPILRELKKDPAFAALALKLAKGGKSCLIKVEGGGASLRSSDGAEVKLDDGIKAHIKKTYAASASWAGTLDVSGAHTIDLRSPAPGPHFAVNLLIGNRIGHERALQTTPKAAVDRTGGGSLRSHAATQVLATRWDMRPEENGFPANRQFYITEGGRQIFYSADPQGDNIESAVCTHMQNRTVIKYKTKCGLEIERSIFILPQRAGFPLATEAQHIEVKNTGGAARELRLVAVGMFGSAAAGALFEDVVYSNVITQTQLVRGEGGEILAMTPDYVQDRNNVDVRFFSMQTKCGGKVAYPTEFCADYNDFVGTGSLNAPQGVGALTNRLNRKGPGFFALAGEATVAAGGACAFDTFTGLVSARLDVEKRDHIDEVMALLRSFEAEGSVAAALAEVAGFQKDFSSFLQVDSGDSAVDAYINKNMPFQIFYQTFVSRSFAQTQKGYREIGFREIQDIYATMYYFTGLGRKDFVKELILEWCAKVFAFGYAFHNFYWEGKEPGNWSDDAIWLILAVNRYIQLTGDLTILDTQCQIAGEAAGVTRPLGETLDAIIKYSNEISIGGHGLPLLDRADWNDCLKLDTDSIDGRAKEEWYKAGKSFGNYSESVMNGFLLKNGLDGLARAYEWKGDASKAAAIRDRAAKLGESLRKDTWKGDFYARVLFNGEKAQKFSYLGAGGDGFSDDPKLPGVYFLNSFSWSLLAGCADEGQISIMLDTLERTLKTPWGFRLMTPAKLSLVSRATASNEYYNGDRENGGIFKHACMMATAAMFDAAKKVSDPALAKRLTEMAYWMVDITLPPNVLKDPYGMCGNPRFCTQYNNSETGENIGPILSGTSSWLSLTLISALGIDLENGKLRLNPVLREGQTEMKYALTIGGAKCSVTIKKPAKFTRLADGKANMTYDGKAWDVNAPIDITAAGNHEIVLTLG